MFDRQATALRAYRRLYHLMDDFRVLGFDLDPESTSLEALLITARCEADEAGLEYEKNHRVPRSKTVTKEVDPAEDANSL